MNNIPYRTSAPEPDATQTSELLGPGLSCSQLFEKKETGRVKELDLRRCNGFHALHCQVRSLLLFSMIPLQEERYNRNDNEDDDEPFCDIHREAGYSPCAQDEKNQGQYKEKDGQTNQISHFLHNLTTFSSVLMRPGVSRF